MTSSPAFADEKIVITAGALAKHSPVTCRSASTWSTKRRTDSHIVADTTCIQPLHLCMPTNLDAFVKIYPTVALLWTLIALTVFTCGIPSKVQKRTKHKLSALSLGLLALHLLPGVAQAAKFETIMARLKSVKAIEGGISSRARRPELSVDQSIFLHSTCSKRSDLYTCFFQQCWLGNCYGEAWTNRCICNKNHCWDTCSGSMTCRPNWCANCGPGKYRKSCTPGTCSAPNGDGCADCPYNTYKAWDGTGGCAVCEGCPPGEFRVHCGGSEPGSCIPVSIISAQISFQQLFKHFFSSRNATALSRVMHLPAFVAHSNFLRVDLTSRCCPVPVWYLQSRIG